MQRKGNKNSKKTNIFSKVLPVKSVMIIVLVAVCPLVRLVSE